NIADMNFSAVRVTDVPLLPKPTASITPVRVANSGPSGQIPQSAAPDSGEHQPANIISIPDLPMPVSKLLIIPPGNQVAQAHMSPGGEFGDGSGSPGANGSGTGASSNGSGAGNAGAGTSGPGGTGTGHGSGAGRAGSGGGSGEGSGAGNGNGA